MRPHDTQTSDVTMLYAIRRILLHFGEYIADNAGVVVGGFLGTGDVDGDVGELGPGEGVVEIVLHEIAR